MKEINYVSVKPSRMALVFAAQVLVVSASIGLLLMFT